MNCKLCGRKKYTQGIKCSVCSYQKNDTKYSSVNMGKKGVQCVDCLKFLTEDRKGIRCSLCANLRNENYTVLAKILKKSKKINAVG